LGDADEIWYIVSRINLLHNDVNIFHLKWLQGGASTYTTLWNVKCSSDTCYQPTIELLQKETPEFNPSQLWPPNSPDFNPVDNI